MRYLAIALLLVSGCSVDYTLKIDADDSVNWTVVDRRDGSERDGSGSASIGLGDSKHNQSGKPVGACLDVTADGPLTAKVEHNGGFIWEADAGPTLRLRADESGTVCHD